ncbi:hypothetical protein LCGC14_2343210, partial [marine sediment metagenome]
MARAGIPSEFYTLDDVHDLANFINRAIMVNTDLVALAVDDLKNEIADLEEEA